MPTSKYKKSLLFFLSKTGNSIFSCSFCRGSPRAGVHDFCNVVCWLRCSIREHKREADHYCWNQVFSQRLRYMASTPSVKASGILQWCDGQVFGYDVLVRVNSFRKAGYTQRREVLVGSHKVLRTSHGCLCLVPYTPFAERDRSSAEV
uniref:Uncharacterized protein n=1 Tax=Pipistrellus kuhlii TaxID=59472 RepID=A0A7J7V0F4_PIPKU|nr:hypothetical protein mPipKuh1_008651 [Pipistrellus kuhlii]